MPDEKTTKPIQEQTVTVPVGTVALVISAFLGAGGTASLQKMIGTDHLVIDRIEKLEERLETAEQIHAATKATVDATFDIVNAAHPARGRVGVPEE